MSKIIIDTETTGLTPGVDEIIELAIIDADTGDILHNRRYGTTRIKSWDAAERINHISPAMVDGIAPLDAQSSAAEIIKSADLIIGWNVDFDIKMLMMSSWIETDAETFDMMEADARLLGEITPDRRSGKWRKLVEAAAWWGFDPQMAETRYGSDAIRGGYHTALTDCAAVRDIYRKYMITMSADYNRELKSKIVMCRNYLRSIQSDMHMIHLALTVASMQKDSDVETQGMLDMLLTDLRTIAGDAAVAAGGLGGDQDG